VPSLPFSAPCRHPPVSSPQTEKLLSQKKLTVSDLKAVCEVLCLERSGSKDELAARIVKFLADPSSDTCKKAPSQPKKRKGAEGRRYCVCPLILLFFDDYLNTFFCPVCFPLYFGHFQKKSPCNCCRLSYLTANWSFFFLANYLPSFLFSFL
jgi:hypothetical protein